MRLTPREPRLISLLAIVLVGLVSGLLHAREGLEGRPGGAVLIDLSPDPQASRNGLARCCPAAIIPLAWRNLTENRLRLLASVAGTAFAVTLMFMENGFRQALLDSMVD